MGPIDYSIAVANPLQQSLQGFALGSNIAAAQEQRAMQRLQFEQQQQQVAAQQAAAQRQQQALGAFFSKANPTAEDYSQILALAPQLKDQLKQGWEARTAEQQKNDLAFGSQAYVAAGRNPALAAQLFRDRAAAIRNGLGSEQEARAHEALAQYVEQQPELAQKTIGMRLAAIDPAKFGETMKAIGGEARADELQPSTVAKSAADAKTAGVTATYAESQALADLQKKGYEIEARKLEPEFKRQTMRIAAMQAELAREQNGLRRTELQLKLDDAARARDQKVRERVAEFDGAMSSFDDAQRIIDDLRGMPVALWFATGSTAPSALVPGYSPRTAAGKLEQLSNSLAAANLDKLKGAMSDKDIAFLKNIATNLDRYQGTDQVAAELGRIEAALSRGRIAAEKKFGLKAPAPGAANASDAAAAGGEQRNIVVDF